MRAGTELFLTSVSELVFGDSCDVFYAIVQAAGESAEGPRQLLRLDLRNNPPTDPLIANIGVLGSLARKDAGINPMWEVSARAELDSTAAGLCFCESRKWLAIGVGSSCRIFNL